MVVQFKDKDIYILHTVQLSGRIETTNENAGLVQEEDKEHTCRGKTAARITKSLATTIAGKHSHEWEQKKKPAERRERMWAER